MRIFVLIYLVISLFSVFPALAQDGTIEGATENPVGTPPGIGGIVEQSRGTYVITPSESASLSPTDVWRDNRTRAYFSSGKIDGYMLFDVSAIPDDDTVTAMTMRCYLENDFGNPNGVPVVDVYYSADDGWDRSTVNPGDLSLDTLLVNDVSFPAYVTEYDFVFNVGAHDWSVDLADNEICIGLTNDVVHYSFLYVFGAYGNPVGSPCELTIETDPVPVELMSFGIE